MPITGFLYNEVRGSSVRNDIDSCFKRILIKTIDSKEKVASRYAEQNLTQFNLADCNEAMVAIYNYFDKNPDNIK